MTIIVTLPGPAGFTFLELVQRLRREVGASGVGPASVLGQTGEYQRLIDYVADADEEIQQEHDNWKFMVGTFGLLTIAGVTEYPPELCDPPINDLRAWKERGMKYCLQSAGPASTGRMAHMDYDTWEATYGLPSAAGGPPQYFTSGDAGELLLGPAPDDVYIVTGKYQRAATRMLADTDTPKFPAEFHMLVVYLAMMKYGRYTGATEVYQDGERLYNKMLTRMRRTQLPEMTLAAPLA